MDVEWNVELTSVEWNENGIDLCGMEWNLEFPQQGFLLGRALMDIQWISIKKPNGYGPRKFRVGRIWAQSLMDGPRPGPFLIGLGRAGPIKEWAGPDKARISNGYPINGHVISRDLKHLKTE